jgi:hypothetical protein
MDTQARIPAGLGAVHNFIMDHDDEDIHHYLDHLEPDESQAAPAGEPGHGSIPRAERERADVLHDEIATQMWESYLQFLQDHPEVVEQEIDPENE